MELKIHEFDLPLRHTFTIARGSLDIQKTLIVELRQSGVSGFGESTTNEYYGATFESMADSLEHVRSAIAKHHLEDPEVFWQLLNDELSGDPFAQCALDQAAYDLWGKIRGKPVYQLLGLTLKGLPPSNYTIGIDDVDVMVAKLREYPGWPVYKIKLGTSNDLEIVRRLRQETEATFRVDANCGWTADETIHNAAELATLGVEFIEQPLPADQWDQMQRVFQESILPVVADESCQIEADVARCHRHFHGINIKLVKCGGMTPARRMIEHAKRLGIKVMVGCMTESSVGISAIAQLLPLLDYVDMDGAVLLANDIAQGVQVRQGICHYPDENGNGVGLVVSR